MLAGAVAKRAVAAGRAGGRRWVASGTLTRMHLGQPTAHRPSRPSPGASRLRAAVLAVVLALSVGLGLAAAPGTAQAAPAPTALTLSAAAGYAGASTTLGVELTSAGAAVAGAEVRLERRQGSGWVPAATLTTGADGRAALAVTVGRSAAENTFRAFYDGDPVSYAPSSTSTTVGLLRRASRLTLTGPRRVADGRAVTLEVRWRTTDGQAVSGPVALYRRVPGARRFRLVRTVSTDAAGRTRLRVAPRTDTRWRARARATAWAGAARSGVHRLDNRPPGSRVRLPRSAPSPRVRLPRQRRAVGAGANLSVTRLSDAVWRQMVGRSWHRGCPVGRDGLRLVRVNYWGYDGYRYRGELVASARAAGAMGAALAEMHARRFPIRSMYRVDRFGWSSRLGGADDYRSMAAGNTSAFNCRGVVGRPRVRSPHSWGTALDVNTWENPYRSSHGLVPNTYWASRSHPRVAWRSGSHPVVRLMARHGLRWTYGRSDNHHFDYVGTGRASRPVAELHPQCPGFVCE